MKRKGKKFAKAAKRPVGAPTKISREIISGLVAALQRGAYIETAAAYAGISKVTLYKWLRAGARGKGGLHKQLVNAVERAMADAELRDLQTIDEHAQGFEAERTTRTLRGGAIVEERIVTYRHRDWNAAAWRLERKFPTRWGRRDRHEIVGGDGSGSGATVVFLPDNGFGAGTPAGKLPGAIAERLGYQKDARLAPESAEDASNHDRDDTG